MFPFDKNTLMIFELMVSFTLIFAAFLVRSPGVRFGLMAISLLHFCTFWISAIYRDPEELVVPGPDLIGQIINAIVGNIAWGIAMVVVFVAAFSLNAYSLRRELAMRAMR